MKARIAVSFKPGVLDPEATTVAQSLNSMQFDEVTSVRLVRMIELELDDGTPHERIVQMCDQLLANPVIEDYRIEPAG